MSAIGRTDYLVLNSIPEEWARGREVLERLNTARSWWRRWSIPAFYLALARLVDAGLVEVKDVLEIRNGGAAPLALRATAHRR